MATIGIDLGTTYSVVAYIDDQGHPQIIANPDGVNLTPSVIAYEAGAHFVGMEAKTMQSQGSEHVASFFKRGMGDEYYELDFFGKTYDATAFSAILLSYLKEYAEEEIGQKVDKAVITVPAYFNNKQREMTIEAGRQAGLEVLSILNEPTAATIAYGFRPNVENKNILVYDLGGGTFDITISKIDANGIHVLSTEGDHKLGGKDFDDRMAEYLNEMYIAEFGIDLFEDEGALNTILVAAEEAKKKLSTTSRTIIPILHDGKRGNYEVTRLLFDELCESLLERTWILVEQAIASANLMPNQVDEIILVGGSTRMPMVPAFIEKRTGIKPKFHLNADEVVSLGAAIQANILENQQKQKKPKYSLGPIKQISDVMSHSLGMIAINKAGDRYINNLMIYKNRPIPATATETYEIQTAPNRVNDLKIYVTQGESVDPLACDILGLYTVSNVPFSQQQPTQIEVTYGYDRNGVVQIEAREKSSNTVLPIQIEPDIGDTQWLVKEPVQQVVSEEVNIMLAIDTSGSMAGDGISESIKAAQQFVDMLNNGAFAIGLLGFADQARIIHEPSLRTNDVKATIGNLVNYVMNGTLGYGTSARPLKHIDHYFKGRSGRTIVIVLTDGQWFKAAQEVTAAESFIQSGGDIIAVGFGEANQEFLKNIASSDEQALKTNVENLVHSFSNVAQVVSEKYRI